jgi:hypothetical protein
MFRPLGALGEASVGGWAARSGIVLLVSPPGSIPASDACEDACHALLSSTLTI